MYITTEGVKSERNLEDTSKITMQATGALSWRRSDIKYRKNEAFVDVIEDVNLLMSATGTVLRADVNGQIVMRAYLSGTPECKFGLNDRLTLDDHSAPSGNKAGSKATRAAAGTVSLEDCQFNQCVKLGKFDADRVISFIPPDGEFELMRYRATENVNLPFKVHAIVNEVNKTRVDYSIAIRANYGSKLFATNVVMRIPTPLNTAKITERVSQGKAKYEPEHNNIVWKIQRFTGQSEYVLNAEASLTSMTHQKAWSRPPLSLSFSLLMFTSSGLLVRYLKVFEKSNYSSVKWVRYMTRAGNYEIRYILERKSEPLIANSPQVLNVCGFLWGLTVCCCTILWIYLAAHRNSSAGISEIDWITACSYTNPSVALRPKSSTSRMSFSMLHRRGVLRLDKRHVEPGATSNTTPILLFSQLRSFEGMGV
jgi:AP-2 complex subunit mu-1